MNSALQKSRDAKNYIFGETGDYDMSRRKGALLLASAIVALLTICGSVVAQDSQVGLREGFADPPSGYGKFRFGGGQARNLTSIGSNSNSMN